MKKSKKQRKNEFKKRIQKGIVIEEPKKVSKNSSVDDNMQIQEDPSVIVQRILLRRVRGHNGKNENEELER